MSVIKDKGIKSVALPRLATGVGGLDWDQVKAEIDKAFRAVDISVYVYTGYKKGECAHEG